MYARDIHGKVTFLMVKVSQDNTFPDHRQICYPINKVMEACYPPIPIAESTLSRGELSLVGRPITDIVKLPINDGICVILLVKKKSLSEGDLKL